MLATKEEALAAALEQIKNHEWPPEPAPERDLATELVLYFADRIEALEDALRQVRSAVEKRQLPITNQVYELADTALGQTVE